jgi:hypothetical protein
MIRSSIAPQMAEKAKPAMLESVARQQNREQRGG